MIKKTGTKRERILALHAEGLTQTEIADATGFAFRYVNQVVNGQDISLRAETKSISGRDRRNGTVANVDPPRTNLADEAVENCIRRVELAVRAGDRIRAEYAIGLLFSEQGAGVLGHHSPLAELGMSARALAILERMGKLYIGQVTECTAEELSGWQMGIGTLSHIRECLKRFGFYLVGEEPDRRDERFRRVDFVADWQI